MKKFLLTSTAAIVYSLPLAANAADIPLKAAPVAAWPQATGYIEVYGGWASTRANATESEEESETFSSTIKGSVLGGAGRGNYWVGPNMSIQLDVQAEGTSYDTRSSSVSNTSSFDYLVGGHVSWRDPGHGLWGAFAGIGDVSQSATRHAVFGGEGQYYSGPFTFYGQLGYDTTLHRSPTSCVITFCTSSGADVNAWFVRATGRYYYTPNIRFEGTFLYADGEIKPSFSSEDTYGTFKTWLWEAKAEWKLDNNPFAFFFKYRGSQTDYNSSSQFSNGPAQLDAKVTDNRFLVGARMYLGEGTLLWNDRKGTTLDIISPLAVQSGPLYSTTSFSQDLSDIRLKRDIRLLSTLDNGLKIYAFKYLWSDTTYVGVMAQDLLANPAWRDAVIASPNGFYAVDYAKLGLKMTTLEEWDERGLAAIDIRRRVSTVRASELQAAL